MSELILKAKAEAFMITVMPTLRNFPSFERHGLTADIKRLLVSFVTSISLAESVKSRRLHHAQESDGYLESLMAVLRVCANKQFKYISSGFYTNLYTVYGELKRLLIGFIRSAAKR